MSFSNNRGKFGRRGALLAGVGLGLLAAAGFFAMGSAASGQVIPAVSAHPLLKTPEGQTIADVVERVMPSVVSITAERRTRNLPRWGGFFSPFSRRGRMPKQQGLGSGVIVSADGIVVTNNHVIDGAEKIKVVLNNKREYMAKVLGTDPKSDLAVIKLKKARGLKPIVIGDSEKLRLGDPVLAVGSPFGLSQTVTMGIVSAKGRANLRLADYEDFIQTDAAINPGNSGGALVNIRGELVGINTAIASRTGGYMGIGFAIPTNMVKPIMSALVSGKKVVRGWMGVTIQEVSSELARELGLPTHKGVLIADVSPRGPARKAGIKRGDLVIKIDGKAVDSTSRLRNLVASAGSGRKIRLDLYRNNKPRSLWVKLGELPANPGQPGAVAPGQEGLTVAPLDPQTRRTFKVPRRIRQGVVLSRVDPRGPAAASGLQRGDVILEVNRGRIRSVGQFYRAYGAAKSRVLLLVYRQGSTIYMLINK